MIHEHKKRIVVEGPSISPRVLERVAHNLPSCAALPVQWRRAVMHPLCCIVSCLELFVFTVFLVLFGVVLCIV